MATETIKTSNGDIIVTRSTRGFSVVAVLPGDVMRALCGPLNGSGWAGSKEASEAIVQFIGLGDVAIGNIEQFCLKIDNGVGVR
jgi:hypothetical protein